MSAPIDAGHYGEAASAIREQTRWRPQIGLVLGSGLSGLADAVEEADIVEYEAIPYCPVSTVPGHGGRMVLGKLRGKEVVVMQGRVHYYEGYSLDQVTFPIRVMHLLGVHTLIATNAAGGLNPTFHVGDLMLLSDHLNMLGMAGHNPLRGPNIDSMGPRFPDMTEPYDRQLRKWAHEVAAEAGFGLQEGVYAYLGGPNFETPAEIRYLRLAGADAVGMSTVPSVLVARHAGMRVLGISTITNMANPEPVADHEVTHSEVLEVGAQVVPRLTTLLHGLLRKL